MITKLVEKKERLNTELNGIMTEIEELEKKADRVALKLEVINDLIIEIEDPEKEDWENTEEVSEDFTAGEYAANSITEG